MYRKPLLELLARYRPLNADDEACRDRYRRFVTENTRCFDRALLHGHVTGSAWIVDPRGERVLLTHHRKLGRWLQLGGHADGDPDVLAVALREAGEESGISEFEVLSPDIFDLDIHEIPARKDAPAHLHYDARFALRALTTELARRDEESLELAWIELSKLGELTAEESLLRMERKWRARKREERTRT
jgi:8-oxo-dGTP pyrophosphatase MutT (NUDIX family)